MKIFTNRRFRGAELLAYGLAFGLMGYLFWTISFAAPRTDTSRIKLSLPSAPTELRATALAPSSIKLTWTVPQQRALVNGYYIIRDGVTIAQTDKTSYEDTTVQSGDAHSYVIEAYNRSGQPSGPSNRLHVAAPVPIGLSQDNKSPSVPASLRLTIVGADQVNLQWDASSDNQTVKSYEIFRNDKKIASVSSTSFGDTATSKGTAYVYRVVAVDQSGNRSAASNKVSITIPR